MDETEQIQDLFRSLNLDIHQRAADDGLLFEEAATRHLTDLLADVDLTADVIYCTESHQNGNVAFRIDAFALGEDGENLDLFVVQVTDEGNQAPTLNTDGLNRLSKLAENFLDRGINGNLKTDLDRISPAYELATRLHSPDRRPVRARVFVLTNSQLGTRVQGIEERRSKQGILMQFHVWDLERFYRTSTNGYAREPIQIDFVRDFGGPLPCLAMPAGNEDYRTYLAIVPGSVLADIYEKYGARLLEQNVRSFLQFGNKTNRGIRKTINDEPHRFLAYNNGLTATAGEVGLVDLTEGGGKGLGSIHALQIVNGGQTTASIFQTRRMNNASLSNVFVQMKLTVMGSAEEMATMVPLISLYANTQNGVSPADYSSNSTFNTELERVSRTTTTPAQPGSLVLTRWFFERARGQYTVELARRLTRSSRTAFERENPRSQVLTKETTAKFYLAWEGKPYIVASGAQNLYTFFIRPHDEARPKPKFLPKLPPPDQFWFKDVVAKAILFRSAEKLYDELFGRGGGFRAPVVCYTVSWVRFLMTQDPFSLGRIWQLQKLTDPMREVMRAGLTAVNEYLRTGGSTSATPSEWVKKSECWTGLQARPAPAALRAAINILPPGDRAPEGLRPSKKASELALGQKELVLEEQRALAGALISLGEEAWESIEKWGRQTKLLSERKILISLEIARAINRRRALSKSEIINGHAAIDAVLIHQPDLLLEREDAEAPATEALPRPAPLKLTLDLLREVLEWERRAKRLTDFQFSMILKIVNEKRVPRPSEEKLIREIVEMAMGRGFQFSSPV